MNKIYRIIIFFLFIIFLCVIFKYISLKNNQIDTFLVKKTLEKYYDYDSEKKEKKSKRGFSGWLSDLIGNIIKGFFVLFNSTTGGAIKNITGDLYDSSKSSVDSESTKDNSDSETDKNINNSNKTDSEKNSKEPNKLNGKIKTNNPNSENKTNSDSDKDKDKS